MGRVSVRDICLTAKKFCGGFVRRLWTTAPEVDGGHWTQTLAWCARACANPYFYCTCEAMWWVATIEGVCVLKSTASSTDGPRMEFTDTPFRKACCPWYGSPPRPRLLVRVTCMCCVCMAALLYGITLHPSTGRSFLWTLIRTFFSLANWCQVGAVALAIGRVCEEAWTLETIHLSEFFPCVPKNFQRWFCVTVHSLMSFSCAWNTFVTSAT